MIYVIIIFSLVLMVGLYFIIMNLILKSPYQDSISPTLQYALDKLNGDFHKKKLYEIWECKFPLLFGMLAFSTMILGMAYGGHVVEEGIYILVIIFALLPLYGTISFILAKTNPKRNKDTIQKISHELLMLKLTEEPHQTFKCQLISITDIRHPSFGIKLVKITVRFNHATTLEFYSAPFLIPHANRTRLQDIVLTVKGEFLIKCGMS